MTRRSAVSSRTAALAAAWAVCGFIGKRILLRLPRIGVARLPVVNRA
jgi:hypothetical protein